MSQFSRIAFGKLPKSSFTASEFIVCAFALTPLALNTLLRNEEVRLLHGASILAAIGNPNTDPPLISPGQTVTLNLPTGLQSFHGLYESREFTITRSDAELIDGSTVAVQLGNPAIKNVTDKRGNTDVIPLMENVEARLLIKLPADPKLTDSLVRVSVAGNLALIASNQYGWPQGSYGFEAPATFRVGGNRESQLYRVYNGFTESLRNETAISLVLSVILIFTTCVFRAKVLFGPSPPRPQDGEEITLLWACRYGYPDVAEGLLQKGAHVNVKDPDGVSALAWASKRGYANVVQVLLAKGADVNARTTNGLTPLMLASMPRPPAWCTRLSKGGPGAAC